jgi:PAS domain S-box-containing protein
MSFVPRLAMTLQSPTYISSLTDPGELQKETESLLQYGTWVWLPHEGVMKLSEGMCKMLGYSESAARNFSLKQFLQHLPEDDREKFQLELDAAVEKNGSFGLVHALNTGGPGLVVRTRGKVLKETSGVVRLLGVMQNITEQSMLNDEMNEHRRLMDQYEVFLRFGTWEYSVTTQEITWSVGMYSLFGYDAVEDRNLTINEALYELHIDPEDYKQGVTLRNDTVSGKEEYFWQYKITSKTGEVKWLETYGRILRNKEGEFVKTFGITRDITRLKVYEHSLELKIRELNRSNAELEEFAYVASHDMQEPLRKLITFSERLTAKFQDVLQDDGQMYLSRIVAATNNMRLLIDNLLDFSRISRTGEAFETTELGNVLHKVLSDLEVSIEEKQATVTAGKLPVIEAQGPQMKQLFTNILSNALKFRQPTVPPVINITSEPVPAEEVIRQGLRNQTRYYKIQFTDNGIGFEQEYADRIFQIFQRLHGKAEYPGSGIGLAICKKIVEYHSGLIYAKSQLGEGAVITVILPEKQ